MSSVPSVVPGVSEGACVPPQRANLIVAEVMTRPHLRPIRFRPRRVGHRPHDRPRLIRKARCAADVNTRGDALRLLRCHVEQCVRAGAHADCLDAIDVQLIEQRKDVARNVGELEILPWIRRPPVAGKVRSDDAKILRRFGEDMLPVIARSREAVKEQQRIAGAAIASKQ